MAESVVCLNAVSVSTIKCPSCSKIYHQTCAGFLSDVVYNLAKKHWKSYDCFKDSFEFIRVKRILEPVKTTIITKNFLNPNKCIDNYNSENDIFNKSFNGYAYLYAEKCLNVKINDRVLFLIRNNHGFDEIKFTCVVISTETVVTRNIFVNKSFSTHHPVLSSMREIHKFVKGWKTKKKTC